MTTTIDQSREDPLVGFHFSLEIQGQVAGFFTECSGLGSESETIEHKVVNEKGVEVVMKIPGRLKWGDITLKRGITSAMDIWEWRKEVEDGNINGARRDGTITMFDQTLKPVAQWDFNQAWPSKVTGPAVKAEGNEIVLEELTVVHEYIIRKK